MPPFDCSKGTDVGGCRVRVCEGLQSSPVCRRSRHWPFFGPIITFRRSQISGSHLSRAHDLRFLEVLTSADAVSVVALGDHDVGRRTIGVVDVDLGTLARGQGVQDLPGVRQVRRTVVAGHDGTPQISMGRLLGMIALEGD